MKCLFEKEIAEGTMCCDFEGRKHEPGVEQCPTTIFNLCQGSSESEDYFVPETLEWCNTHYVPPVQRYITCESFGHLDSMDGSCFWCKEMTPYQWHMCSDESWMRSLLGDFSKLNRKTRAEAISFIDCRKQRNSRNTVLYNADPNCNHNIVSNPSGGIICTKCGGWFCY